MRNFSTFFARVFVLFYRSPMYKTFRTENKQASEKVEKISHQISQIGKCSFMVRTTTLKPLCNFCNLRYGWPFVSPATLFP